VEVESMVSGARAEHKVDVWVEYRALGLMARWVVDCKYWNSAVPKAAVLTLKGVVEDIGADRGFLVSESGFQTGAFAAASNSNIMLASLGELEALTNEDMLATLLNKLDRHAWELQKRMYLAFYPEEDHWYSEPRSGVDEEGFWKQSGGLGNIRTVIERARMGDKFPMIVYADSTEAGEQLVWANGRRDLVEKAKVRLDTIETWLKAQENTISRLSKTKS